MTLPNLFLIGAPKAGTTFLYQRLVRHAEIFGPRNKEPAYFLYEGEQRRYRDRWVQPIDAPRDLAAYSGLYADAGQSTYAIDASTHYLSSPETAQRISVAVPDARIIAILREPVARAHSHYLMGQRDGMISEAMEDALTREIAEMAQPDLLWSDDYRMIRRSLYHEGLEAFHAGFGSENMRVYLFEDIRSDIAWVLRDLGEFLGLDLTACLTGPADEGKNPYAANRFPVLTHAFNAYRASRLRAAVNALVPRFVRDKVRSRFERARTRDAQKPTLPDGARKILDEKLGDDYERALEFARQTGILRKIPGSGTA